MQYPLYEFYKNRSLTLEQVIDHYVTRFYAREYNGKDVLKVLTKVRESSKIKNLCGQSATRRIAPNYIDFASTINEMIWFVFKSNMTQALGVLFAALYWDEKINSVYHLKSADDLKDDIIKVFKKFSIYEEMTESEFMGDNSYAHEPSFSAMSDKTNERKETEREGEKTTKTDFTKTDNNATNDKTWDIRDNYDFNESFKKHALTILILRQGVEFRYFASQNAYSPMWSYVINSKMSLKEDCPLGAEPFVWIMNHYENREDFCWLLEILDEQIAHLWVESMKDPIELIHDIQRFVPSFKLKNDPQSVKTSLAWSWIDMHAILYFIDYCLKPQNKSAFSNKEVKTLQNCSTLEDLVKLYYRDKNKNPDKLVVKDFFPLNSLKEESSINLTTEVTEEDRANAWTDEYGVIYSADRKRLLKAPKEIEEYSIREGTVVICDYAFSDGYATKDRALTSVTIPDSVIAIGNMAFFECHKMKSIIIPNNVRCIGFKSFFACGFSTINIPSFVNKIGFCAFGGNENMVSIVVDNKNRYFDSRNNCNAIIDTKSNTLIAGCPTSVIPDGVKNIGKGAFWMCTGLSSLCIPSSVIAIEDDSFKYCNILGEIKVDPGNSFFDSRNNCNALIETKTNTLIIGNPSTVIPYSVSVIGPSAFEYSGSPKSIIIPNSVREISDSAFKNCIELVSITIPESVVRIGNSVFQGCTKLQSVHLSDNLETIGEKAFDRCKELTSIIIPRSINIIKSATFMGCLKLDTINIPNGIQEIGESAFSNCEMLKSVEIPNSIKKIGSCAFYKCSHISSVVIPEGVIEIGKEAFSWCANLQSVTIADSVEKIGQSAFWVGNSIPSFYVHIGKKEKFEKLLPAYKNSLYEVEYAEDLNTEVSEEDWDTAWVDSYGVMYSANKKRLLKAKKDLIRYSIGIGTVTICDGAFDDCRSLTNVVISNTTIKIGKDAFRRCSSLMKILLPKSVTDIHDSAFQDCTSLVSVTILGPVNIGKNIFSGCVKLELIYIPSWSGIIDLHEYNDLIDRTQDYPFVCSWSIEEFIEMYGEMHIEEKIDNMTGGSLKSLVFENSFGKVFAGDEYYWGGEKFSKDMKANKHLRIGQDKVGKFWLYDRTLDFWLPGMSAPY